jgi:hypothetical protein
MLQPKRHAERRVKDALATRNSPNTKNTLDLPLQLNVRVGREKEGWTGPYKLIATEEETCTIDMPRGPAKFRSTVVKPYLIEQPRQEELEVPEGPQDKEPQDKEPQDKEPQDKEPQDKEPQDKEPQDKEPQDKEPQDEEPQETQRGRGRPKGSRNVRLQRTTSSAAVNAT